MNNPNIFLLHFSQKHLPAVLFPVSFFASVCLTYFISYPRGSGTDGAFYALSGANFFLGNGFTYSDVPNTFTWPLFSVLIGFLNLFINDLQVSGHIVLVLSFSLGIFPFYYAVRNLFDEQTALIAAGLYFMNGFLLRLSGRFLPESLLIFFLLCSLYFVSEIIKHLRETNSIHNRDSFFTGFFFGLSYLTKPEAIQYFFIAWLFLSFLFIKKNKRNFLHAVLMILIFGITIFPQLNFIHETTGKWELSTYNRFLFRGYIEPLVSLSPGEVARDPTLEYNYNAYIVRGSYSGEQFDTDLSRLGNHTVRYMKSLLTIIGPFHLLLLFFSFFSHNPAFSHSRHLICFLLIPVLTLFLWYNPVDRHFIVFIPFFIILSSSVLYEIFVRYKENNRRVAWFIFTLVLLQSFTPIANQAPTNAVIGNHRKLGEWMRDHMPDIKGKLIADRKPYIAFLVQGRYYRYDNMQDIHMLIQQLKDHKVEYLVVDDFYTRTKNPGVIGLLDGRDHSDLRFIHAVEDNKWGKALLYKIVTTPQLLK